MADGEREDSLPHWRADGPPSFAQRVGTMMAVLVPVWVVLIASRPSWSMAEGFLISEGFMLFFGTWAYRSDRQTVMELRVETEDAGMTLMLRRRGGQIRRVPLIEVESVRVTLNTLQAPPVLGIGVRAGGENYWTEQGPKADVLMSVLRAGGVNVITREAAPADDGISSW